MVISPQHLAAQWMGEVTRFCPLLKVCMLDLDAGVLRTEGILEADIFIITLDSYVTLTALSDNYLPAFFRIVVDECHDVGACKEDKVFVFPLHLCLSFMEPPPRAHSSPRLTRLNVSQPCSVPWIQCHESHCAGSL